MAGCQAESKAALMSIKAQAVYFFSLKLFSILETRSCAADSVDLFSRKPC